MIHMIPDSDNTNALDEVWLNSVCEDLGAEDRRLLEKAVDWAVHAMAGQTLETGEPALKHAAGVVRILSLLQVDVTTMVSGLIASMPAEQEAALEKNYKNEIINHFGLEVFNLVQGSRELVKIGLVARNAGTASQDSGNSGNQQEMLRKMLLAMATDLRIVLVRLASRLQTLRWFAETKKPCPKIFPLKPVMCMRHWPIAWGFGKSNGKWKTFLSVFLSPKCTRISPRSWKAVV